MGGGGRRGVGWPGCWWALILPREHSWGECSWQRKQCTKAVRKKQAWSVIDRFSKQPMGMSWPCSRRTEGFGGKDTRCTRCTVLSATALCCGLLLVLQEAAAGLQRGKHMWVLFAWKALGVRWAVEGLERKPVWRPEECGVQQCGRSHCKLEFSGPLLGGCGSHQEIKASGLSHRVNGNLVYWARGHWWPRSRKGDQECTFHHTALH